MEKMEKNVPKMNVCSRLKSLLCFMSLGNFVTFAILIIIIVLLLYLGKTYIKTVLLWLENQDLVIVSVVVVILFVVVSFPISVGYIILVVATGYLFSILRGLLLVVIGANMGVLVAHNVIKLIGYHHSIRNLLETELAKAIMRVINGPLCFKIVLCARLTPIPFGLQNTIFALSNVSSRMYVVASVIGLLPAQLIGVCVGSTLRSMQDVLENQHISGTTYFIIGVQLTLGISLMAWVTAKARKELLKILNEANTNYSGIDSFSYV